jgi:uncharacterized protein (TIGR02594 family)
MQEQANRAKQLQREDERQQGIQDALREQAGEEMRGVQTGSLFRQHSSFYMAGLNETRGRAAAARFKAETAQAYLDWEGRHTDDDGSAYRAWMNERVANFMSTLGDDQHRVAGALPIINEVANNFAAQHTGFTAERLETESFEAYDEIVSGIFLGLANGEFDMDEAVERIAAEADDMYLTDGAAANNRVVDAAIRYANIHNNPDSILALARAHDSGRLRISQSNREKLANAMDAVEADIEREASRSNAQATAAKKAADQATMNAWAQTLEENPYAEMPPTSEVPDAALRRDMMTLAAATRTAAEVTNPSIEAQDRIRLETDLHAAGSIQEKIRVLSAFAHSNPTALSGADISRYTQAFMAEADPGSIINDPMMGRYRTGFGQTLAEFQLGDGFDINRSSYLRTQGEMHYNDYLLSQTGTVDTNDRAAMRQLHTAATEYAMEQLAFDFPEVLREKQDQSPLGENLGVGSALETRDAAVAAEAARIYQEAAAVMPVAADTREALDATSETPVETIDDPAVDDDAETIDPEVIQSKPDSFYQEVLNRFTDGSDDRENVSPSVLVETAKRILGADENAQNGLITQFLADGGVNLDPSETAWCAGFINAVLAQNGIDGTKSLAARSFLGWGERVTDPTEGDIVVVSRGRRDGWEGHVGIFQGFDENGDILILGGNQSNGVNVTAYPAERLLGYRRPVGTPETGTAETIQALAQRGT